MTGWPNKYANIIKKIIKVVTLLITNANLNHFNYKMSAGWRLKKVKDKISKWEAGKMTLIIQTSDFINWIHEFEWNRLKIQRFLKFKFVIKSFLYSHPRKLVSQC